MSGVPGVITEGSKSTSPEPINIIDPEGPCDGKDLHAGFPLCADTNSTVVNVL